MLQPLGGITKISILSEYAIPSTKNLPPGVTESREFSAVIEVPDRMYTAVDPSSTIPNPSGISSPFPALFHRWLGTFHPHSLQKKYLKPKLPKVL